MLTFRKLEESDWDQVSRIYQEGLDTGNASFEKTAPEWKEWDEGHLKVGRIVAEIDQNMAGWAALSPVSSRCVYGGVAEVSIYISELYRGRKIGEQLLENLILASENEDIWTLQAGIFPENIASLHIHEKLGFRTVGYREKIGKKNGIWRDTVLLERRSKRIGLE